MISRDNNTFNVLSDNELCNIEFIIRRTHKTQLHLSSNDLWELIMSTTMGQLAAMPNRDAKFIIAIYKRLT